MEPSIETAASAPGFDPGEIASSLLNVVSEKTGYPSEMLELDMDMEADLGIDSIKRVEILGAMRSVYPDLPKVEPEAFAEMRTLGQVIEHIQKTLPGGQPASAHPEVDQAAAEQTDISVGSSVETCSLQPPVLILVRSPRRF
jgi:acyl carrier protein